MLCSGITDEAIYAELVREPQTRKTLLGCNYYNYTKRNMLNRRLERMLDTYDICKGVLVGKYRGEVIFFPFKKDYTIVVLETHEGIQYYYCRKMEDDKFGLMKLCDCKQFVDEEWKDIGDIEVMRKKILYLY